MLNLQIGEEIGPGGRLAIFTKMGTPGYAVWGGYEQHPPAKYCALFEIELHGGSEIIDDAICAQTEVISIIKGETIAFSSVTVGHLRTCPNFVRVYFELSEPRVLMFRVYVTGEAPLIIGAYPRAIQMTGDERERESLISAQAFPEPSQPGAVNFLAQNSVTLRQLHDIGAIVSAENDKVIICINNIRMLARETDDLTFIPEVFFSNTYNFMLESPTCVIDVGMNVGLATLFFAAKESVREVHSFEPFKETFERALANIALNPQCAGKIFPNNYGLAGRDEDVSVSIPSGQLSGANSTRAAGGGSGGAASTQVKIKDAASVIGPIIKRAQKSGLTVVAKIDCEGSEFSIFESLEAAGLLCEISAFMVEWHRGYAEKTQHDLFSPLLRCGYVVFDVTPNDRSAGNGFFYAVRSVNKTKETPRLFKWMS